MRILYRLLVVTALFAATSAQTCQAQYGVAFNTCAITPTSPVIAASGTQQLTLTCIDVNGNSRDVTNSASWVSGDTDAATVDDSSSKGLVTAVATGSSPITATLSGKVYTTTAVVVESAGDAPAPGSGDIVLFSDDFENETMPAGGAVPKWDDTAHADTGTSAYSLSTTHAHGGTQALLFTGDSSSTNAHINEVHKWSLPGVPEMYFRYYAYFDSGWNSLPDGMHWIQFCGNRSDNQWSCHGQAGIQPSGSDFFSTGLDPEYGSQMGEGDGLHPLFFYSYWPGMTCGSPTPNCYGNWLRQTPPRADFDVDMWHEIVVHIKLNSYNPSTQTWNSDGFQEFWVDGALLLQNTGMQYRTDFALTLNEFDILNYIPDTVTGPMLEWLDDVTIWYPVAQYPLAILTSTLGNATQGSAYSSTLQAYGGLGPYAWSLTPGSSLPAGLSLNANTGVISGTPSASGTFNFSIRVTDSQTAHAIADKAQSLTVTGTVSNPSITTSTPLPTTPINVSFSQTLSVSGGVGPYTWSVTSGSLPTGLSLGSSTGTISGTPTAGGNYGFTITVTDSLTHTGSKAFTQNIGVVAANFSDNFESCSITSVGSGGKWYDTTAWGPSYSPWISDVRNGGVAHSGNCSIQAHGGNPIPSGVANPGFNVMQAPWFSANEVYVREWVRVSDNWAPDSNDNGLHLIRVVSKNGDWQVLTDESPGTGDYIHFDNTYFSVGCDGGSLNQKSVTHCDAPFTFSFTAHKGTWSCWEQRVKINSSTGGVANADGILQFWVDGTQVYSKTDIKFGNDASPAQYVNFVSNEGGGGTGGGWNRSTTWLNWDDLAWGTSRVGCN